MLAWISLKIDFIGNNVSVSLSAANDANFSKNYGKFVKIREIRGQEFYFRKSPTNL